MFFGSKLMMLMQQSQTQYNKKKFLFKLITYTLFVCLLGGSLSAHFSFSKNVNDVLTGRFDLTKKHKDQQQGEEEKEGEKSEKEKETENKIKTLFDNLSKFDQDNKLHFYISTLLFYQHYLEVPTPPPDYLFFTS